MITKSDLRLYLDSPRHLWAKHHDAWHPQISDFDKKNAADGYRVEALAMDYLRRYVAVDGKELRTQQTFTDGEFLARADGLVYKPETDSYDLYEVKSSTIKPDNPKPDNEHIYDITFQALILEKHIKLDNCYLLMLNANYRRGKELNLQELFFPVNMNEQMENFHTDVLNMREEALRVSTLDDYHALEACFSPKDCGCKAICHPDLPEHNIYELFSRSRKTLIKLRDAGKLDLLDLPADLTLSGKAAVYLSVYQGAPVRIDTEKIRNILSSYEYPIYFLDYETTSDPIPQFEGITPYQRLATQYSLHIAKADGTLEHVEYIFEGKECPLRFTVESMLDNIGTNGTVLAWNESFEKGVNADAAKSYPDLADRLLAVNDRVKDLGDVFKNQYYMNRDFHCSWSIKKVLPVMCPELSYKELPINHGDQATSEWNRMVSDETSPSEKAEIKANLLRYCELDTFAMVRIWEELMKL